MNGNYNNKPTKAQRKAQSQRDKQSAMAPSKKSGGKGKRKQNRGRQLSGGPQGQAAVAAAYATGQVGRAPAITMSRDSCRIQHRELIASVMGSDAFTVQNSLQLNPGLAATFPWLSLMAQGWEQYRFRNLRFCYYTRTGSNVPGSVLLAPDYDSADGAPVSEQIASAYEDVAEDAPWKDIECHLHRLSMAAGTTRHFTRSGPLAANLDIKTYDVGQLFVCTVDGTAVKWGKLWVEYDVEFFVPQLPPNGPSNLIGGKIAGAVSQTAANPFGVVPVVDPQANGISMSNASVLSLNAAGTFLVAVVYNGTVVTALPTPTLGAGVTIVTNAATLNAGQTIFTAFYTVTATSPSTATMAFSVTASTITAAQVNVGSMPEDSEQ